MPARKAERRNEDPAPGSALTASSLIRSLPTDKMDSPNSARFRLVSRGDIPTATVDREAADERRRSITSGESVIT